MKTDYNMTERRTSRVVFQPDVYRGMQRGIDKIVSAIRPTLGPLARTVAIERSGGRRTPELLDDGGTIARRIIELPDRDEDMGAMLVRHLLWRLREQVGDGTATAAVIFGSVYDQGVRYIASGGNAMQLRRHLEAGSHAILAALSAMTQSVDGKGQLALIAESVCYDPPLARMLGEIFDIVGEYGRLELRSGRSQNLEREYVEGMYWDSGIVSREMITDHAKRRTELEDVRILISDLEIDDAQQMLPVVHLARQQGTRALLIVATKISESALALLLANNGKPEEFFAVGVKLPGGTGEARVDLLQDLAVLAGGQPIIAAAGDTLTRVGPEHLGRARRAWAGPNDFGIVGGQGDARELRQHIARLHGAYAHESDADKRRKLQERIGKLMGGAAVLWVGGMTKPQIDERKDLAERTAEVIRSAVRSGVLPGGGVALLDCRPVLERLHAEASEADERAAYRILLRAVEEPMRVIIANGGADASETMAHVKLAGPGHGYDVRSGQVVNMNGAGILDAASVQMNAVGGAISTAALALTIDVLVHHREPEKAPQNP